MTTVKELITQLNKMPQEAVVILEGCDCWNAATRVENRGLQSHYNKVTYERDEPVPTVLIGADVYMSAVTMPAPVLDPATGLEYDL